MLELGDQVQELVRAVGPLQCDVRLPSSWEESVGRGGQVPAKYDERRRHPRYHFRVCAALEYRRTFPSLNRPNLWHQVFTNDLSRGGLSFLHSEQLFPRERMRILLPGQGMSSLEIVWCVRVQDRCFRVGARFVEQLRKFTE
jgi:hypothetical protein